MRYLRLVAVSDDYDNKPGLMIKGTRKFDDFMAAREGLLIAHDVLEHVNGFDRIGEIWDELEALGAIWYVRGRWGDMATERPNMHSPHVSVASDVSRMFAAWVQDPWCGPDGLSVGSRPHDHDEDFSEICEIARKDIPGDCGNEWTEGCGDEWTPELDLLRDRYLQLALQRMRSGFRKAQKRYERGQTSRFFAHGQFCAIRDAVASVLKRIDYEGQEFRLAYGNGEATCFEIYEGED